MPVTREVSRVAHATDELKRTRKRKSGKTKHAPRKAERPITLRDRIWVTTFEWAKQELRADNETAREIANAGIEHLEPAGA